MSVKKNDEQFLKQFPWWKRSAMKTLLELAREIKHGRGRGGEKMDGNVLLVLDKKKLEELGNKIQASLKTNCTKFVLEFSDAKLEITKPKKSGGGVDG